MTNPKHFRKGARRRELEEKHIDRELRRHRESKLGRYEEEEEEMPIRYEHMGKVSKKDYIENILNMLESYFEYFAVGDREVCGRFVCEFLDRYEHRLR